MAYKGNDLDLRTAYVGSSGRNLSGSGPITVDDLVLSCCNGAYDAARFHASPEVRLEHLLHALTRVAAAADILSALGIRTDHLRRETAIAIAAAIPTGSLEETRTPAPSAALEDVLRRAADAAAAARRAPASVHDVLRVLLRGGPESPAATLLMHAASDPQQLQRWRDEPRREAFVPQAPEPDSRVRLLTTDAADALTSRLDHLEAALRTLGAEISSDRKTIIDSLLVVQSDLQGLRAAAVHAPSSGQALAIADTVREVQAELRSELHALRGVREMQGELRADLQALRGDRDVRAELRHELQALRSEREAQAGLHTELQSLLTQPPPPAPPAPPIGEALEGKLSEISLSLDGLGERLAPLDRLAADTAWQPALERLEAIERMLADRDGAIAKSLAVTLSETVSNALSARLDQVETQLQRLHADLAQLSGTIGERQVGLDASVRAHLQGAEEASKAHERDLGEIYEALVKLGTNQQTLGDNLNTWRLESSGDVGIISNRLQQLEQTSGDLLSRFTVLTTPPASEIEGGRSNGFKRWLYGTSNVLGRSWRDDVRTVRRPVPQQPPEKA